MPILNLKNQKNHVCIIHNIYQGAGKGTKTKVFCFAVPTSLTNFFSSNEWWFGSMIWVYRV